MTRFVAGLVGLVHGLGLPVIAEGVEQQDEADVLDELGGGLPAGVPAQPPGARRGPAGLLGLLL